MWNAGIASLMVSFCLGWGACILLRFSLLLFISIIVKRRTALLARSNAVMSERLSFVWAWNDPAELSHYLGNTGTAPTVLGVAAQKPYQLSLAKLFAVAGILIYQSCPRSLLGCRPCRLTPNCSNYAIGLLRRYGMITAWKLSRARIDQCDGFRGGIDFGETDTYENTCN
jgi:putative component of membrane protein insertase Oxa1/YidC/SpoIIIJ protein YidD